MANFIEKDLFDNIKRKIKKKETFNISAIFTGTDKSLGYRTGKNYNLKVKYYNEHISIEGNNTKLCLYSSSETLLKNWNIKNIK